MLTITDTLTRVRDMLDEQVEGSWLNAQLRRWLNDGLDDLARETRQLTDVATFNTVANQAEYLLPDNILEIDNVYFTTADARMVPLAPVAYEGVDQVWGHYQNQSSYQPQVYTLWGYPPTLMMRLYPVPNAINVISLRVVRTAVHIDESGAGDADPIDFPSAWQDTLVDYCEMRALRKDRDPRWQEAQQMYMAKRDSLKLNDYMNISRNVQMDDMIHGVPAFIADWNYRG